MPAAGSSALPSSSSLLSVLYSRSHAFPPFSSWLHTTGWRWGGQLACSPHLHICTVITQAHAGDEDDPSSRIRHATWLHFVRCKSGPSLVPRPHPLTRRNRWCAQAGYEASSPHRSAPLAHLMKCICMIDSMCTEHCVNVPISVTSHYLGIGQLMGIIWGVDWRLCPNI